MRFCLKNKDEFAVAATGAIVSRSKIKLPLIGHHSRNCAWKQLIKREFACPPVINFMARIQDAERGESKCKRFADYSHKFAA